MITAADARKMLSKVRSGIADLSWNKPRQDGSLFPAKYLCILHLSDVTAHSIGAPNLRLACLVPSPGAYLAGGGQRGLACFSA